MVLSNSRGASHRALFTGGEAMIVLSYGFKLPESGDRGSIWFPALEDDIQQLNDHTHDGSNSAALAATAIQSGTVSVPSGSWASDGTGRYKQTVTCPAGFTMDYHIQIVIASSGNLIHPTIEKLSGTTFRIYTLDNTLTYTAVFR